MKNGTEYAKRIKRVYKKCSETAGTVREVAPTDPVEQLVLAALEWGSTRTNAKRAFRSLRERMVDLNEVRVSSAREISSAIREFIPDSSECARSISLALNDVFRREHRIKLDGLTQHGRREARHYLESLAGVNPYVVASVMLWSLGGHGIPANQRLLSALRREGLVDQSASPAEVQGFLERNIAAAEAKRFCMVMEDFAAQKGARPGTKSTASKKRPSKVAKASSKRMRQTKTTPKKKGAK